jgi:hypothetical protein
VLASFPDGRPLGPRLPLSALKITRVAEQLQALSRVDRQRVTCDLAERPAWGFGGWRIKNQERARKLRVAATNDERRTRGQARSSFVSARILPLEPTFPTNSIQPITYPSEIRSALSFVGTATSIVLKN